MNKTGVEADSIIIDPVEGKRLLGRLDGLPLAIAQAGAYLQESGVGVGTYLKFYEQQWKELMEYQSDAPLQDYSDRSVWTTWTISYNAVQEKNQAAANLLLLWAFLDNRDLWYGLFAAACSVSTVAARRLSEWIGDIASNELKFSQAIQILRNYSLIEDIKDLTSYATHPVIHRWAYHFQGENFREELAQLAVIIIGLAVPDSSSRDYSIMQRRLLPHAQVCFRWVLLGEMERKTRSHGTDEMDFNEIKEKETILSAIHLLGLLYGDQDKLTKAEEMYERALRGNEETLGAKHILTLNTINNLGILYKDQGKLTKAEEMYERALRGNEETLGAKHILTLNTINNLGILYKDQGKLTKAEKMYERALKGYEDVIGLENVETYKPALNTMCNRGTLYVKQGELTQAREAYLRTLKGFLIILGPSSDECQKIKAALESLNLPPRKTRCVLNLLTRALTTRADTNNSGGPPVRVETPEIAHVEITKKPKLSTRRAYS